MVESRKVYRNSDGIRRTLHLDDDHPNIIRVQTEQTMDEIMASIERDRELHQDNTVNKLVARIPVSIFEQACHEEWDEDDWKRWLNSSEGAPFRIWRGRV